MPKLGSETINTASGFSFSGESIQGLDGNDHYTLACITIDCSSSTAGFIDKMRKVVEDVINDLKKSKAKNSILIRVSKFYGSSVEELIGYTLPEKIDTASITNKIQSNGSTPLYDATVESIESAASYGKQLAASYYTTNAVVFVITDGEENTSRIVTDPNSVRSKIDDVKHTESLESIKTILIGLCDGQGISSYLANYKDGVGFDDYVNADLADQSVFRKLGNFVSESVSSTSQALGTGAPSQSLTF